MQQIPLFAGLDKRDRKRVAPLIEEIEVDSGKELAHAGELAHELFVIEEGTATVSRNGSPIVDLGPGDFFGEIALLGDDRRRTSTVVATSRMRLAVLRGPDVRVLDRELPEVARQIRAAIDERLTRDRQR